MTLPVIVDAGLELFNEIGVIVLPTTLFFKPDGTLDYKYAGLPSSAELDLKDDLEAKLGIEKEAPEDRKAATRLAYLPKNNALLFFNLGKRYHEKGSPEKAQGKYIEALQKDPDYDDPLRALESIFFDKGRTPEAEERLKVLLTSSGLEAVTARIGQGEAAETPEGAEKPAEQAAAPAGTPEKKELTPMERMRLLMEKK